MDRRAFIKDIGGKATACATVLAAQVSQARGNTEDLAREISTQIADLQTTFATRLQACEKADSEIINALQNATSEVFASCENMKGRLDRLEIKNAFMIVWLSILTIVSGTDFLTPFIDQLHTLV